MTSTLKTHQHRETRESRHEEEITTTVLPPIYTTTYNSPLAYPIYTETHQNTRSQQAYSRTAPPPQTASRMEYIPFERKKKGYETKEIIQRVPVQKTIIEYEPVKKINYVPKQRVITDYYVIEHQTAYVPRNIQEKVIDYVPIEKYSERIQYKPVEKQILHYPKDYDPVTGNTIPSQHHSAVTGVYISRAEGLPSYTTSNVQQIHKGLSQNQTKQNLIDLPIEPQEKREIINQRESNEFQPEENFSDNIEDENENEKNQINIRKQQIKESVGSINQNNLQSFTQNNASLQHSQGQVGSSFNYSPGALPMIGVTPLGYRQLPVGASNPQVLQASFGQNFIQGNFSPASFAPPAGLGQSGPYHNVRSFNYSNGGSLNSEHFSAANHLAASNESFGINRAPFANVQHFPPQFHPQGTRLAPGIIQNTIPAGYPSPIPPQVGTPMMGPPFTNIPSGIPVHNQFGTYTTYLSNQYPGTQVHAPAQRDLFEQNQNESESNQEEEQYESGQEENSVEMSQESSDVDNRLGQSNNE